MDFLAFYGSEYYCPLSLVRIYGLTQIDAYRRDQKLERRSKVEEESASDQQQVKQEPQFVPETNLKHSDDAPTSVVVEKKHHSNIFLGTRPAKARSLSLDKS